MGIILRNATTGKITFYIKGADSIMKEFIHSRQKKGFIDEECKDLAMTGLRTLIFAKKELSEDFYKDWSSQYEKVYNQIELN